MPFFLFRLLPLTPASHGPVLQPDGEDREGKKDVVTDTLHAAGHHRPPAGELTSLSSPQSE